MSDNIGKEEKIRINMCPIRNDFRDRASWDSMRGILIGQIFQEHIPIDQTF